MSRPIKEQGMFEQVYIHTQVQFRCIDFIRYLRRSAMSPETTTRRTLIDNERLSNGRLSTLRFSLSRIYVPNVSGGFTLTS